MQMILEISEQIEKELDNAEKYSKSAIRYKNYNKEIADVYNKLSQDSMKHVDELHESGVKAIALFKAEGKTIPQHMQNVYDYLHERHVNKAHDVKMFQTQFVNE